jgi:dTDP-4-amino-4,6-dideoxygalactose transaminase
VAARRAVRSRYEQGLSGVTGIDLIGEAPWASPNHWLSAVRVKPAEYGHDSRWLLARLRDAGVETRPLWQPLHRSPAFGPGSPAFGPGSAAFGPGSAEPDWIADGLHRDVLCVPSSVSLTVADQTRIVALVAASQAG